MQPENNQIEPQSEVDWKETIEHAKAGYANAREVIKFVDTKTGVMTGLLMLTTAAPLALLRWSAGLDAKYSASLHTLSRDFPSTLEILVYGLMAAMLCGVIGIMCAVDGLMARDPKRFYQGVPGLVRRAWDKLRGRYRKKNDKPSVTVLFPIFSPEHRDYAIKRFEKVTDGFTRQEILEEYRIQFPEVGRILERKVRSNQRSVSWFYFQLVLYVATALAAYIAFRLCL